MGRTARRSRDKRPAQLVEWDRLPRQLCYEICTGGHFARWYYLREIDLYYLEWSLPDKDIGSRYSPNLQDVRHRWVQCVHSLREVEQGLPIEQGDAVFQAEMSEVVGTSTIYPTVITDAVGRTVWVNPLFTQLCGYELRELTGIKVGHRLQGPRSDAEVVRQMSEAVRRQQEFEGSLVNYHKDRHEYTVCLVFRPVCQRDSAPRYFLAVETQGPTTSWERSKMRQHLARLIGRAYPAVR